MPYRPAWLPLMTIAALAVSLAVFWPGFAMYDTVAQFGQVIADAYDDWHPPAMARLWAVLHGMIGGSGAPMFVLQMALYWLGLGLIADGLARVGRRGAAVAILAIGALPPFLGWQAVILKDCQMTGALLAATGLVAWPRLIGRPVGRGRVVIVAILIGYAMLVRANAIFAGAPLAVMLARRPARSWPRIAMTVVGIVAVLVVEGPINHRLLDAEPSGVVATQAKYDLAGIATRVSDETDTGVTRAEAQALTARHCVKPFFWDPLGDPGGCEPIIARLSAMPPGRLYALLATSVLHHPFAYAAHRLAHLNSTERWLVPAGWLDAAPPTESEPNTIGLGTPGAAARGWQWLAGRLVETPLGWPIAWLVVAFAALAVAVPAPRGRARDLAMALLASALVLEASFAVLSIASDLRYHLWPMIATALAAVLLADCRADRRTLGIGAAALALIVTAGTIARAILPAPPSTYRAMLG